MSSGVGAVGVAGLPGTLSARPGFEACVAYVVVDEVLLYGKHDGELLLSGLGSGSGLGLGLGLGFGSGFGFGFRFGLGLGLGLG